MNMTAAIASAASTTPATARGVFPRAFAGGAGRVGGGGRFGAMHSQMPVSWLMGITGLKIVAPSTPADAKGLLQASIRDENPVVFLEHKRLYPLKGATGEGHDPALGRAAVVREGDGVTLVSAMKGVHDCLAAATLLEDQGVDT